MDKTSMKKKQKMWWWKAGGWWWKNKVDENFGDYLGPYLYEKITGNNVEFCEPEKTSENVLITVGSVMQYSKENVELWGTGIIDTEREVEIPNKVHSVRGPISRKVMRDMGVLCPEIFGDPALILPKVYSSKSIKKYKISIIPNLVEYDETKEYFKDLSDFNIISLRVDGKNKTKSVEDIIDSICQSEKILSSSLHGIIVAHAYGIPATWAKLTDKMAGDGNKYHDYYNSINIEEIEPINLNEYEKNKKDIFTACETYVQPKFPLNVDKILFSCPFLENNHALWKERYEKIDLKIAKKISEIDGKRNYIKKWFRKRKKEVELDGGYLNIINEQQKALVRWSINWDIGLKELERLISDEIKIIGTKKTINSLDLAIEYLCDEKIHDRFSKKLYTAAVRALGENHLNETIKFADRQMKTLHDERALRTLITLCNRARKNSKSLEYINQFSSNKWSKEQKRIIEKRLQDNETKFFEEIEIIKPRRPEIRVACILDEFSWENLRYECDLFPLTTKNWKHELSNNPPDFLLVESAWAGNGGEWRYKITYNQPQEHNPLFPLLDYCKKESIPTVFWNKEDPPNYDKFIDAAKRFDFIFTTDRNCISKYMIDAPDSIIDVLPFAAQPEIQNPINKTQIEKKGEICFAGAWYARHPERFKDLNILLKASESYDTHIYDRYLNHPEHEKYKFPKEYQKFIKGSLSFKEMNEAYKEYDLFLNVNSVKDSPTMFSRRVLEIIACGTPVVSGYAEGIEKLLGTDIVPMCKTLKEATLNIDKLQNDVMEREKLVIKGQRVIFDSHTYERRMEKLCKRIGVDFEENEDFVSIITATIREEFVDNFFLNYKNQTFRRKELIIIINENKPLTKEYIEERASALKIDNYTIIELPEETTLGECLNAGLASAKGNLFAKMDDDDYYGENYLVDSVQALKYSKADCVGKETYFTYSEGLDQVFIRSPNRENRYTQFVIGTTLVGKTELFPEIKFGDRRVGEDTVFLKRMIKAKKKLYSHSKYNYFKFYGKSLERHTWKIEAEEYLKNAVLVGDGYDKERYCC